MNWTLIIPIIIVMFFIPLIGAGASSYVGMKTKDQLTQKWGDRGQLFVGFLGTFLHESGHAIVMKIFHHKITGMKLIQFRHWKSLNTLGYVNDSYDRASFYQRLGNFFVGIAPFFSCSGFLYLIHYYLIGTKHNFFVPGASVSSTNTVGYVINNSLWNVMNNLKDDAWHPTMALVFALLVLMVSVTGFSISNQDWKISLSGLKEYLVVISVTAVLITIASYFDSEITTDVWKIASLMIFLTVNSWIYMAFSIFIVNLGRRSLDHNYHFSIAQAIKNFLKF